METIKGQVVKVQTTKDQCIRITVDVEKAFVGDANLITWQDNMVTIKLEE
jgi:hypothetical protein